MGNHPLLIDTTGGSGTTQDLWATINADSGTTTANSPTDVLTVVGAGSVSTSITGDTLTITGSASTQNLWSEIQADVGIRIASSPNTVLKVVGAGSVSTSIALVGTEDVLTITGTGTTYSAGAGLTLVGTTFSHTDTSSVADVGPLTGWNVIDEITFDTYGHVLTVGTRDLSAGVDLNFSVSGDTNPTGTVSIDIGDTLNLLARNDINSASAPALETETTFATDTIEVFHKADLPGANLTSSSGYIYDVVISHGHVVDVNSGTAPTLLLNSDNTFFYDSANPTSKVQIMSASVTPGNTRRLTMADQNVDIQGDILDKIGLDVSYITAASYTLVLGDAGNYRRLDDATSVALTVPTNASVAFDIGTQIILEQAGTGAIEITGASGVSIYSPSGLLSTASRFSSVVLTKVETNGWTLAGDLA